MRLLTWRNLAIAGAVSNVLLTARAWLGRPLIPPGGESWEQQIERRLGAVEIHLQDLEDRLNARAAQHG